MNSDPDYIQFMPEKATIRFFDEVNDQSILQLCDKIELCFNYYHYDTICIELQTPGGSVQALKYYTDVVNRYTIEHRKIIETKALLLCCSAGAIMLSLGSINHRSIYRNCMLIYHYSRITSFPDQMTAQMAKDLIQGLEIADKEIIDLIYDRAHETLNLRSNPSKPEDLEKALTDIFSVDKAIEPKKAIELGLADWEIG